jgi:RimJ/RimL family protein N-acetyltransferase
MLMGKLVGLRAVEPSDLPQLLSWRNNSEYRNYFREYRELSLACQQRWYETVVLKDPNTIMFSIVESMSSRLLGACGLCYINWINRNADFSIYIGADNLYIDKKFAPDAALVMKTYAFEELNLHRLWAEVYDFDERKINFFKKLGFIEEGRHKESYWNKGKWHDSLIFGFLKEG